MNLNLWPKQYDGRAILGKSHEDHSAGVPLAENQKLFAAAKEGGDVSRLLAWAYVIPLARYAFERQLTYA